MDMAKAETITKTNEALKEIYRQVGAAFQHIDRLRTAPGQSTPAVEAIDIQLEAIRKASVNASTALNRLKTTA